MIKTGHWPIQNSYMEGHSSRSGTGSQDASKSTGVRHIANRIVPSTVRGAPGRLRFGEVPCPDTM